MEIKTTASRRRHSIVELLGVQGTIDVKSLSEHFGVTESTIRRDLAILNDQGRVTRTYGGVQGADPHVEHTLQQRWRRDVAEKLAIAKRAVHYISSGDTVMMDSGTTVALMTRFLQREIELTVVTPSLALIPELISFPNIQIDCLGGRVRRNSYGLVGPYTQLALKKRTADRAFLGADAISLSGSICEAEPEQIELKEQMIANSGENYVLADSAKIGITPFHHWHELATPYTLITDQKISRGQAESLKTEGITIDIVQTS